jgi:hypothetical protein
MPVEEEEDWRLALHAVDVFDIFFLLRKQQVAHKYYG